MKIFEAPVITKRTRESGPRPLAKCFLIQYRVCACDCLNYNVVVFYVNREIRRSSSTVR